MQIEVEVPAVGTEAVIAGLKSKEKWSEEDGRALLEVFEASGLKPTAFCQRYGLAPHRLWWRLSGKASREKKGRQRRAAPLTFAPVRLVGNGFEGESRARALGTGDESMQVVLDNGRRVAVGPKFEGSALARLVKVLEGLSC